ncbi:MAG: glutamate racemase [Saprospiraceae bacterium]
MKNEDLKNLPIGIFDSGIGGITALKTAMTSLPNEKYIYFADTDNVPYGTKTSEQIIKYIYDAVKFLDEQKIKILVIACNTATSAAREYIRSCFDFPVLGMVPAVKPAIEMNKSKRILVLATTYTLRERHLNSLISNLDKNSVVDKLPLDKLVRFAEKFDFSSQEIDDYLIDEFSKINVEDYETVVLGCTHFIFYRNTIMKFFPQNIALIDGNEGTIRNMVNIMHQNDLISNSESPQSIDFFSSGRPDSEERVIRLKELLSIGGI